MHSLGDNKFLLFYGAADQVLGAAIAEVYPYDYFVNVTRVSKNTMPLADHSKQKSIFSCNYNPSFI